MYIYIISIEVALKHEKLEVKNEDCQKDNKIIIRYI
jgi:hypothetical protein